MTYHILFATNQAYLQHAVVSIHSILLNNRELKLHFHILYREIRSEERENIREWLKTRFPHAQISFYAIESDQYVFPVKPGDAISEECYFRILAADVLPDWIKTVLYMDGDTICLGSIKELFMLDIGKYALAGTLAKVPAYRKASLGLRECDSYFQSGVMLMNLDWWRRHQTVKQCLAFIEANPDILLRWDQDALNAVLASKIKELDSIWNVYLNTLANKRWEEVKPKIIHYTGSALYKPWYKNSLSEYQHFYLEYREQTPYEKKKLVNCENARFAFWTDLVSKNDRVILYGTGKMGQLFYRQNLKGDFCKIVLWVDKRFKGSLIGGRVESFLSVLNQSYEYILLAVEEETLALQYASELIAGGVSRNKILWKRSLNRKKVTPVETLSSLEKLMAEKIFVYGLDEVCASLLCYCKTAGLTQQILKIAVHEEVEGFTNVGGIEICCLDNLNCFNQIILVATHDMGNMDVIEELQERGCNKVLYLTYSCYEELKQVNRQNEAETRMVSATGSM